MLLHFVLTNVSEGTLPALGGWRSRDEMQGPSMAAHPNGWEPTFIGKVKGRAKHYSFVKGLGLLQNLLLVLVFWPATR